VLGAPDLNGERKSPAFAPALEHPAEVVHGIKVRRDDDQVVDTLVAPVTVGLQNLGRYRIQCEVPLALVALVVLALDVTSDQPSCGVDQVELDVVPVLGTACLPADPGRVCRFGVGRHQVEPA
jgi:hypothetical protein